MSRRGKALLVCLKRRETGIGLHKSVSYDCEKELSGGEYQSPKERRDEPHQGRLLGEPVGVPQDATGVAEIWKEKVMPAKKQQKIPKVA